MTPITRPMTSSLASSEIPITQPYPDVIVDLRGLGLELGLELGLGLREGYAPARPNLMCQRARPVRSMTSCLTSPLNKLGLVIFYL